MSRPFYSGLYVIFDTLKSLYRTFKIQGLHLGLLLAFVLFILAILFSFLIFSPVLSPFVYPLF